jgi:hypothetical protein
MWRSGVSDRLGLRGFLSVLQQRGCDGGSDLDSRDEFYLSGEQRVVYGGGCSWRNREPVRIRHWSGNGRRRRAGRQRTVPDFTCGGAGTVQRSAEAATVRAGRLDQHGGAATLDGRHDSGELPGTQRACPGCFLPAGQSGSFRRSEWGWDGQFAVESGEIRIDDHSLCDGDIGRRRQFAAGWSGRAACSALPVQLPPERRCGAVSPEWPGRFSGKAWRRN